jgi:hypothetical protein
MEPGESGSINGFFMVVARAYWVFLSGGHFPFHFFGFLLGRLRPRRQGSLVGFDEPI